MASQRPLTSGEIALARAAFGNRIAYGRVKLGDGPGNQPLAHLAFAKGNPAITVGATVYFKSDYCPDFSAAGARRDSFIHEMTHVWQYEALGMPAFFARYGIEFAKAGGDADKMYQYRDTDRFDDAMLEAQAAMVEHYSVALWSPKNPARDARLAKRAKNLAGSKVYGL
jgi:hypothetical protein